MKKQGRERERAGRDRKVFYPESTKDNFQIKISSKYNKYKKRNVYISKFSKIGKKFNVGFNSVLINVKIGDNVSIGSNCVITNSIIEDNVIVVLL